MSNPYQVIKDFEKTLSAYTGAPYAVAVNSCTNALLLAVKYRILTTGEADYTIPQKTYVGVPMSILNAGGRVKFHEFNNWVGQYELKTEDRSAPIIIDSARYFTGEMYFMPNSFMCCSFHATKILGDTQGGCILHDNPEADKWFRKARFDGRTEGVAPKDDNFDMIGYHCMMTPDVAARLLVKLSTLPAHNDPLPNDDYPDLSQFEVFK